MVLLEKADRIISGSESHFDIADEHLLDKDADLPGFIGKLKELADSGHLNPRRKWSNGIVCISRSLNCWHH